MGRLKWLIVIIRLHDNPFLMAWTRGKNDVCPALLAAVKRTKQHALVLPSVTHVLYGEWNHGVR